LLELASQWDSSYSLKVRLITIYEQRGQNFYVLYQGPYPYRIHQEYSIGKLHSFKPSLLLRKEFWR